MIYKFQTNIELCRNLLSYIYNLVIDMKNVVHNKDF